MKDVLDRIVNKVYEIEYSTMTEYIGNYTILKSKKELIMKTNKKIMNINKQK